MVLGSAPTCYNYRSGCNAVVVEAFRSALQPPYFMSSETHARQPLPPRDWGAEAAGVIGRGSAAWREFLNQSNVKHAGYSTQQSLCHCCAVYGQIIVACSGLQFGGCCSTPIDLISSHFFLLELAIPFKKLDTTVRGRREGGADADQAEVARSIKSYGGQQDGWPAGHTYSGLVRGSGQE